MGFDTVGQMGYPELARILRRVGITKDDINQRDARELFRRMVLNILIDNTDDHEKNHSLLVVAPFENGRLKLLPSSTWLIPGRSTSRRPA